MNPAGQGFREFLQLQWRAPAATFFKQRSRDRYETWWYQKSKQGYHLGHWLVNRRQLGLVEIAYVCPSIAVDSGHLSVLPVLHLGRMERRQVEQRPKHADLAELRGPETK